MEHDIKIFMYINDGIEAGGKMKLALPQIKEFKTKLYALLDEFKADDTNSDETPIINKG